MILQRFILLSMFLPPFTSCAAFEYGDNFYKETDQKNRYFIVERKNVDFLTPATVLSLRDSNLSNIDNIPKYLGTLCNDYPWMNSHRLIYIFENSKYSAMFDSFGVENIKKGNPIDKFVASYNPDDQSITYFPLLKDKRKTIFLNKDWCSGK